MNFTKIFKLIGKIGQIGEIIQELVIDISKLKKDFDEDPTVDRIFDNIEKLKKLF